eukprot:gene2495-520_t
MPFQAYIVETGRTAFGKNHGRLSSWHPVDLGAACVDGMLQKVASLDPRMVDDVIFGCVGQVGPQSNNIGRSVVLSSKFLPQSVPGTTCDRQCGSSLQAVQFACQAVMSGTQDIVIAGGVETMSKGAKYGGPIGEGMKQNYPGAVFSQFNGAEILADRYNISRQELDEFSARSHQLAAKARDAGLVSPEIIPVQGKDKAGNTVMHTQDEGIRDGSTAENLSKLKTLKEGGAITAGASSQIADGLQKLGKQPLATIVDFCVVGDDPVTMLYGPVPATQEVLQRTGMRIQDIGLYEINEAFASVPLAWLKQIPGSDPNRLNVFGGAIAIGHPLGATGARLVTTLVNALQQRQEQYGLLAICEGGGTANAMVISRGSMAPNAKL